MKNKSSKGMFRVSRMRALAVLAGASVAVLVQAQMVQSQSRGSGATPPATSRPAGGEVVASGVNSAGSLEVMVNKTAVLSTRSATQTLSVGQPDIADVNVLAPNSILVTGKKMGTTQIIVWDENGRSQTIDVTVGMDLKEMQDRVNKMFPRAKVEVAALNGSIMLSGRVPDLQTAEQVVAIASPYSQKVMNFMEVSGGQQIMLQVRFAEVSRGAITSLGFRSYFDDGTGRIGFFNGPGASPIGAFAGGQEAVLDPGVTVGGAGQIGNVAFEAFLSAMKTNNLLRVLAEPNLVAISGQEASFLAGGEIPVPVPQSSGSGTTITIEYKPFGVRLNFVPVVLGDGRVRLKCSPEVSELDYSNAVTLSGTQIPALNKRNVTTTVELRDGQTFAIAGLLNDRVQASRSSTPYLGELPILGALFRSVRYERKETELLVLVTPKVVSPLNPDQVPTIPGEQWRHPNEHELYWNRDIGADATPARRARPTTMNSNPRRFHGQYGFVPATQPTVSAGEP